MLKSLELFGFKSFADRTRFDFSTGVTGVVGPNGSGKSNVVDSIKWLLGDQSAKSLRGKEMSDVIFNGSSSRKPAQVSEALLTFDNKSRFLPIDLDEVQIGRRLWRSGDSEYLINQQPVRLKDVRNLISGTGTGGSAYAIIEQGRVGQILQANVSSRRAIVEEAAGISRYKSRKVEAQRKLEHVDQNLKRLTDIVDEVESQLNSTRDQAVKASRYRDLSLELKQLWLGLAADDYRYIHSQGSQIKERLQSAQKSLDEKNSHQSDLESQLAESEGELNEIDERLTAIETERSQNREQVASLEATQRHQTSRIRELENELTRLQHQRSTLMLRAKEGHQEHTYTRDQLNRFRTDFESQQNRIDEGSSHIQELSVRVSSERLKLEDARKELLDQTQQMASAAHRVESLQDSVDSVRLQIEETHRDQKEIEKQLAHFHTERNQQQEVFDAHEQQLNATREELQFHEQQNQELSQRHRDLVRRISTLREDLSGIRARKTVLEDLEIREEGIGLGVREILKRANSSEADSPWKQIRGSVVDLLEVDLLHAAELEVALGMRAQLIVVDDAAPIMEHIYLNQVQLSERVGFFSLAQTAGRTRELEDFSSIDGVVQRADKLVTACPIPDLPELLLAETWLVETLDVAFALQKQARHPSRFVTLQGELLEADGTLYLGSLRTETSLITRKSELRQLRHDIQLQEKKIDDQTALADQLHVEHREALQHKQDKELQLKEQTERFNAVRMTLEQKQKQVDELTGKQTAQNTQSQKLRIENEQLQKQLESAFEEHSQAEKKQASLQSLIEEKEHALTNSEHRLQLLKQSATDEQLQLAKQEERLSSLQTAFDRLEHELGQRLERREEAEERYKEFRSKLSELRLQLLKSNSELADQALSGETLESRALTQIRLKRKCRDSRAELVDRESKMRQVRRELSDRVHKEEIRLQEFQLQLKTLRERIEEEYQLTLEDVVSSGASAVQLYWQEENLEESTSEEEQSSLEVDLDETSSADDEEIEDTTLEDQDEELDKSLIEDSTEEQTAEQTNAIDSSSKDSGLNDEEFSSLYEQVREEIESRVSKLRQRLKTMGSINTESLDQLDSLETRFAHLSMQLEDLTQAKNALEDIIRRINTESKRMFIETYDSIRVNFKDLFRKLFGGGNGDIILEDPDDPLECGIEIVARPPGKELRSISLLSGGEKTMTAVALLMAIFRSKPSPFCILDEVDAALDEANIGRFINVVKEFQSETQFIMITHRKPSMTVTDRLFGVTMEESGVSKRLTVQFDDIKENGEFDVNADDNRKAA
ncbi:Chromosome partition protein Smc [Polystyrenella longa]|uniref:Chromosome partition protein Smc n=1 Tax=Polystyrenella longa TaxID=2528007 RepID=A0A518CJ86_9PLAN|nr:chromosome segregation protein SMC [Polystyrenella longa]QDU79288.1 Chromosome partition protein Smc [Polystyrenella longa]